MDMEQVVCDCAEVTVGDVLEYMKDPTIAAKPLEERLEIMEIGIGCGECLETDCEKIDVHYSEIMKD